MCPICQYRRPQGPVPLSWDSALIVGNPVGVESERAAGRPRSRPTLAAVCRLSCCVPRPWAARIVHHGHGISMEPNLYTGGSALLHRQQTYRPGDVIGFRSRAVRSFTGSWAGRPRRGTSLKETTSPRWTLAAQARHISGPCGSIRRQGPCLPPAATQCRAVHRIGSGGHHRGGGPAEATQAPVADGRRAGRRPGQIHRRRRHYRWRLDGVRG